MAKRNRSTLKNYFRQGAMPLEEHFSDLIDSTVNQIEEGFSKPPDKGLQLTAMDQIHLLSFHQQNDPQTALWKVRFDAFDKLQFVAMVGDKAHSSLTLDRQGHVGINTTTPKHELEVQGVIAGAGRMGTQLLSDEIPADGQWHDLTPALEGCQMFEVVAGVGIRHSGRYALVHAIAINTCAPSHWWGWLWWRKNPIKTQQAYFRSTADKLKLRWKQDTLHGPIRPYVLQIRSNTAYPDNRVIRYHLTQLWHDRYMEECVPTAAPEKEEPDA